MEYLQTHIDNGEDSYDKLMWWFSEGMSYTINEVKQTDVFDFYKGVTFLEDRIKKQNKALK